MPAHTGLLRSRSPGDARLDPAQRGPRAEQTEGFRGLLLAGDLAVVDDPRCLPRPEPRAMPRWAMRGVIASAPMSAGAEPAAADRRHRATHRRGEQLLLRSRTSTRAERRLLHRLETEGLPSRIRAVQRRSPPA